MGNRTVDSSRFKFLDIAINEEPGRATQTYVFIIHGRENPYALSGPINYYTYELDSSLYYLNQGGVAIRTKTSKTYRFRRDFRGLFNAYEKEPLYEAASWASSIQYSASTFQWIKVFMPPKNIEQNQRLITTIPNALSSWGGAFSVAWGVFYFLFGSPRLNPFGLIATSCLGNQTKQRLTKMKKKWRKDSLATSRAPIVSDDEAKGIKESRVMNKDVRRLISGSAEDEMDVHMLAMVLKEYYLVMDPFEEGEDETDDGHAPWYKPWQQLKRNRQRQRADEDVEDDARLQGPVFTTADLDVIAEQLREVAQENLQRVMWKNPYKSPLGMGYYDLSVLEAALNQQNCTLGWFDARRDIAECLSQQDETMVGLIVHVPTSPRWMPFWRGQHWFGVLRLANGAYVDLDSRLSQPTPFAGFDDAMDFLKNILSHDGRLFLIHRTTTPSSQPETLPGQTGNTEAGLCGSN
ncbi:Josephin-1 [Lunasporangiospora selenospora]|uniref:ubiquitinyl hydrolase 1 n=1 Tax=Lunasporangiospora selenospora TaxID=979761 RepID=A0A9P6FXU8_9FUNG|nr:Josephin-1 [Lunasporangiospora selenospora]